MVDLLAFFDDNALAQLLFREEQTNLGHLFAIQGDAALLNDLTGLPVAVHQLCFDQQSQQADLSIGQITAVSLVEGMFSVSIWPLNRPRAVAWAFSASSLP